MTKRRGHKRTGKPVGKPPFVPTDQERAFVAAMAGLKMSGTEIAKVIGAGRYGLDGGKPISKSTLFKHFKNELANGGALLKAKVTGKFYAALDDGKEWAVTMAMRNRFNWDSGRGGFDGMSPSQLEDAGDRMLPVQIEFIVPAGKPDGDHDRDHGHGPYPWQKALPPPIERPAPRLKRNITTGEWELDGE